MKRLIVTADDVGLHRGMTEGAIRGHREGIVTACSIVANGEAFDDAVARLKDVPSLECGVHLTVAQEWPRFVPMYVARLVSVQEIERDWRAQIEKVMNAGLTVTHLNGHQHLHLLPRLFAIAARLAREYRVPYVRIVDDRGGGERRAPMAILSALGRRARQRGLTNDHTIGVANAGHLTDLTPLFDHVEGITELVMHPGVGVGGFDWGYEWEGETRALCDSRLRDALHARGIELTSPRNAAYRSP